MREGRSFQDGRHVNLLTTIGRIVIVWAMCLSQSGDLVADSFSCVDSDRLAPLVVRLAGSDYPLAVWDAAPLCNYQNEPVDKVTIVLHMLEGTAAEALARFKDCDTQASVHYIVSESGFIWQMVRESHIAWHVDCGNRRTIAIAHEGYSTAASYPDSLYLASARLAKDICQRWGIPKRRAVLGGAGIAGKDEWNAACSAGGGTSSPPAWDWDYYLEQVNDGVPAPAITAAYARTQHGLAGDLLSDVTGNGAIEARRGGVRCLEVIFDQPIEGIDGLDRNDVSLSSGYVNHLSIEGYGLTVEMDGVADGSVLNVSFPGIARLGGLPVSGTLRIGILEGDADNNGRVDLGDLVCVRDQLGRSVTTENQQQDINSTGRIDVLDLVLIRNCLGHTLPESYP